MKSSKTNSLQKLLSFLLIAILIICVIGFAASGWQAENKNEPDSGNVGDTTDEPDENKDGNNTQTNSPTDSDNQQGTQESDTPKYYNKFTGLEITEKQFSSYPLGFSLNPTAPLYGISDADISFEFPLENGKTRLLSYISNYSSLWKIGTITPTRDYMSATSAFIGGVVVCYGNDDIVKYSAWEASQINLDISKISNCYFIENTLYVYTNTDMINSAVQSSDSLKREGYKEAPYIFSDALVSGTSEASTVLIPYSQIDETELYYSDTSEQYLFFKSGTRKVDMLSGKNISFTNVFVLFANSTTYEKADGTELVIDNLSGGSGYYISKGYMTEIRWNVNESGELEFKTLNGEKLAINKGNAYVAYYKASETQKVTVS